MPATAGGSPFPERDVAVALALGTVVVTLVLPALTLPLLIRGLGVKGDDDDDRALEVRARLVHAALGAIEEIATDEDVSDEALDRARERHRWRLARLQRERGDDSQPEDGEVAREYRDVAHRLVRAERTALGELRARHDVTGETLRAIERDLDLEEARLH